MKPKLYRPEPVMEHDAVAVDRTLTPRKAVARLWKGESLIVTDRFTTGAKILGQMEKLHGQPKDGASYEQRQAHRARVRAASLRLLAPISGHRLNLTDARSNGFLAELYPELTEFVLPFAEVQSLRRAWQRYRDGVHLAVLGHRIHPLYGTYAPTRVSHLELFGTWLSQYSGARSRAVDVGTGCGVLALMLCKAGFERVLATDCNPNAVESVAREMRRLPAVPPLDLVCGDLFGDDKSPADLVVFNPPWMPGRVDGLLDRALVYEDDLFERFFDQAAARLTPEGRIVLVFSNVIELTQPDAAHPIQSAIDGGRLRLVQKLQRKVKASPSREGHRRRTRERVEVWELALT